MVLVVRNELKQPILIKQIAFRILTQQPIKANKVKY
jgi:hypothetical protein